MKKLKKISLKKEEIVNLNDESMKEIKGGTSSWPCGVVSGWVTGKILDYTVEVSEYTLKQNTVWVGCTTDPNRSYAYTTPGCIKP